MRLRRIELRDFQQFQHTVLDFTNPATGDPVDRVCLIGRNGTGKSTILRLIRQVLQSLSSDSAGIDSMLGTLRCAIVDLEHDGERYCVMLHNLGQELQRMSTHALLWHDKSFVLFNGAINEVHGWRDAYFENVAGALHRGTCKEHWVTDRQVWQKLQLSNDSSDLLIYSPAETAANAAMQIRDVPGTNLGEALKLGREFPWYHEVSRATVASMWRFLLYRIRKYKQDREEFELAPENLDKTKRHLIEEFDRANLEPLSELAGLWNKILAPAGLEFDFANARLPVQLQDNLKAYVRHISGGETVAYNQLSTGIRDFLFRIGHLFLLYFERHIERGFVLIDEPENSLFPDFLFALMEVYDDIVRHEDGTSTTQIFMATHNPIVAAQFEPYERVILEWNERGYVTAKKGVAPAGDDPNDVLEQDFELTHLMGKRGLERWARYLELKKQARRARDDFEKQKTLLKEASEIARQYRFGHEEP